MTAAERSTVPPDVETLRRELEALRSRNRELEQTLDAIRSGEVDAIVVSQGETSRVYALEGADHPYRVLVENIQEGALTLTATGMILYANAAFAAMRGLPLSAILGTSLRDHLIPRDQAEVDALVEASRTGAGRGEMSICSGTATIPVLVSMTPLEVDSDTRISVVVTDRRQDYGRLRLQGRMLDSVADAVTATDPDGTILYWNRAAERLYGRTAAEMVGRSMADATEFGVTEAEARQAFAELSAGLVWSGEHMARHRNGRRFPVLATRAPVYDEDGALVAVIATSHDISERKEAEEALRESEAKYRSLVDLAPDGVVVHRRGVVQFANPAAARILRAPSPGDLAGTNILDLVHPDDRAIASDRVDAVQDEGRTTPLWELRFLIDGRTIHADAVGAPIAWEGAPAVQVVLRDITARKRAEAALEAEQARLRATLDAIPLGVWIADPTGRILETNAQAAAIWGGPPRGAESLEGSREYRGWWPETGEPVGAGDWALARALRTGEVVTAEEVEIQRFDGRPATILNNAAPIRDTDGRVIGGVMVEQDITRRKQVEAALKGSEERHAFLLELNDALAPLADPAEVQARATRVLGGRLGADRVAYFEVDADDYIVERDYVTCVPHIAGRHPGASFGPRLLAVYRAGTTAVEDDVEADPDLSPNEQAGFAAIQVRAYIGVPLVKAGAFVGGLAVHMATPRTWTPAEVALVEETAERTWAAVERARAEAALRESEGRFRSVLDHSVDALYRLNLRTGCYEYTSPAFERVVGRTAEEMSSENPEEAMTWIHPDDLAVVEAGLARLEETGAAEADYRVRGRDGRYRWISNHLSLVRDGSGRPLYRDGVVSDITAQKEAELALRENAECLQRSNEDLQRFAYVASHDLQEPLRSVVSFSQLLERRYKGQLGQDADEYIDFIVEGGNRMQSLILDLLAFSRVNTTRQQIGRTDAEDVLAEAVRSLDVSLCEAGAMLTHDPLPVVMADPTQLGQVFSNLVSNAIKFRKPDVPLHIHVGVRRTGGFWEFSVSDNGIGIEPEYFEKIFVIFQRLHTREMYPGTGIGLAIVKRIIDRHGGTIRVESTPGEGATFLFTLPAA